MSIKLYQCDCYGEGLSVELDVERIGHFNKRKNVNISLWTICGLRVIDMTFIDKIRWIWTILTKGRLHTDTVILNEDTAKEMANDILNFYKE